MKNIAVIIPAYNEEKNILKLIKRIKNLLPKSKIYIIDDSPGDKTKFLIEREKINYYHRKKKLGRGSAVLYGMKKTYFSNKYNIFIEMDADLSHNPNELIKNINYFKKNKLDLLVASRYLKKSRIINWPISRKILSFLSNYLASLLLKLPVTDYTNGFRIYSKRAVRKIINNCGKIGDGFIILSEILLVLHISKYKINEVSSVFINRVRGESSVNLKLIFFSFLGLLNLFFKKNKYMIPIK
jgi:dolichol-phosphate mannosyltransferase